jgi:hypothetical protein
MAYKFERECRTPYSEAYLVLEEDGERIGRLDLHFTPTVVHATLCVQNTLASGEIQDLIDVIDEELVTSADTPREDLVVAVYQGQEVGVFSDQMEEEWEEPNGV